MVASKFLIPLACLAAGVALGAFVVPGPYVYGESKGAHFRVNRCTGVEQYASSKGWVSQQELVTESYRSFFGGMEHAVNDGERTSVPPMSTDTAE